MTTTDERCAYLTGHPGGPDAHCGEPAAVATADGPRCADHAGETARVTEARDMAEWIRDRGRESYDRGEGARTQQIAVLLETFRRLFLR